MHWTVLIFTFDGVTVKTVNSAKHVVRKKSGSHDFLRALTKHSDTRGFAASFDFLRDVLDYCFLDTKVIWVALL